MKGVILFHDLISKSSNQCLQVYTLSVQSVFYAEPNTPYLSLAQCVGVKCKAKTGRYSLLVHISNAVHANVNLQMSLTIIPVYPNHLNTLMNGLNQGDQCVDSILEFCKFYI